MLNLTTRPNDQADMIRHLKEAEVPVEHPELDNETCFWGAVFGGGQDRAEACARRAAEVASVTRELYPAARIGVVASESGVFSDGMHAEDGAHARWNGVLARPEHRGLCDAFLLHHCVMDRGALDGVGGATPPTRSSVRPF